MLLLTQNESNEYSKINMKGTNLFLLYTFLNRPLLFSEPFSFFISEDISSLINIILTSHVLKLIPDIFLTFVIVFQMTYQSFLMNPLL